MSPHLPVPSTSRRAFLHRGALGAVALLLGCETSPPSGGDTASGSDAGRSDALAGFDGSLDAPPTANRAPVWDAIPALAFVHGVASSISVAGYLRDPDGDRLVLSKNDVALPPGVTFDAAALRFVYDGVGGVASTEGHVLTADDGRA
jgi:hypothetical protein